MSDVVAAVIIVLGGIIATLMAIRAYQTYVAEVDAGRLTAQDLIALSIGNVLTINEVREELGFEPVIGGDDILLMTPTGAVSLSEIEEYFAADECGEDTCDCDALFFSLLGDDEPTLRTVPNDFEFYVVLEEDNDEYHGVFGTTAFIEEAEFAVEQLEMRDRSARIITCDGLFDHGLTDTELYD